MTAARFGVFPEEAYRAQEHLWSALGALYGVSFAPGRLADVRLYDGAVAIGVSFDAARAIAGSGVRCLAFIRGPQRTSSSASDPIVFSAVADMPGCLLRMALTDTSLDRVYDIADAGTSELVARRGGEPLWGRQRYGGVSLDLIGTDAPTLSASEYLFDAFRSDRWFSLLALLHFVRSVAGWITPPARACLMFDDPNLHGTTYGYVKYDEIGADAKRNGYHVAFATVPMDAWYVSDSAACLFRDHARHMSLLVHGNNHTYAELHHTRDMRACEALAAQALRRIAGLERRAGVSVSRVMAAPHGACNVQMATALSRSGFEAASISRGSLMSRNADHDWPSSIGLNPAEFFGDGLPIIPRLGFGATSQTSTCLALFLGQAVISMGHHEDLHGGLEPLRRVAGLVNGTGSVQWTNLASIARSNYLMRVVDDVLHVRLYSRCAAITVPAGATRLLIDRPWLSDGDRELLVVEGAATSTTCESGPTQECALPPGSNVTVLSRHVHAIDPESIPARRTQIRAVVRRQLCEVRDRLRPSMDLLSRT